MPIPWTKDEELKLINEIKDKKTYDEISKIHNRSISALIMRYNKIIYDNIEAGKSKKSLAKLFNSTIELITQSYYEHKSFLDKKELTNPKKEDDNKVSEDKTKSIKSEKAEESSKISKILEKLSQVQKENELLKEIIENIKLKNKLNKSLNNKDLLNDILKIIKKYKN